jgi:hypothetical protein
VSYDGRRNWPRQISEALEGGDKFNELEIYENIVKRIEPKSRIDKIKD